MTRYRLKDRALQKQLDAISGGDFSKRLQDPAKSEKGFAVAYGDFPEIKGLRHLSIFLADEIEEVPQDPTKWNKWPDVEPIEGVMMRTQFKFMGYEHRLAGTYKKQLFQWEFGQLFGCEALGLKEIKSGALTDFLFRPWDDHDEEDSK